MSEVKVSIIIVSFNTKELLHDCLASIGGGEIIVVDNGSVDGSVDMVKKNFPHVVIIENKENKGFAVANNQGLRRAGGRYLLLLNSDTEVPKGAIEEVTKFMREHPDVGVVGAKLILPDGTMDLASHRGFPTPWASLTYFLGLEKTGLKVFSQYHGLYKNLNEPHEIDSPSGAFYFLRREVFEAVGGLDEDYFMYGEDLDWSYRIKQKGWKIFFYPHVRVLHHKKKSGLGSSDLDLRKKTQRYFYEAMSLFYKKHYAHRYSPLVTALVKLGIRLRSIL